MSTAVKSLEGRNAERIASRLPFKVQVLSGRAYLTQEGDDRDYVLEQGQAIEIAQKGQVVVQGFPSTRFKVIAKYQ